MWWWCLPVAAYLLGSISFAWFAGKLNGIDLRQHGSGNLGATNAGRVLGRKWFAIVFIADVLKGFLPVLIAVQVPVAETVPGLRYFAIATAVAAVLGHSFTCFHGFKGGKAVATSLGVLCALMPVAAGAGFAVWVPAWLLGWKAFRLGASGAVAPASILAAIAVPLVHMLVDETAFDDGLPQTIFITCLALLVVVRHRSNIRKLMQGGQGKAANSETAPPSPG